MNPISIPTALASTPAAAMLRAATPEQIARAKAAKLVLTIDRAGYREIAVRKGGVVQLTRPTVEAALEAMGA